jgi:peptidoglycan/xylan/chitin deacetylase (PgdA/CDA1 family)
MRHIVRFLAIMILAFCTGNTAVFAANATVKVPILTYHRFGPVAADSMTIRTEKFAAQLQWLHDNHYTVIPLQTLVSYLRGEGPPPPPKSVVITADDGHKSVYTDMLPLVQKYKIPVTLFIYPSAISNASYAMTWQQLQALKQTGLFTIQGHTYWHPNFKQEKKKLSPADYEKFINTQLAKSKSVLEKKLAIKVDCLAWPFGIYDDYLEQQAQKAGYLAAFSIDGRPASKNENMMAQPRYMIVDSQSMQAFKSIMEN